MSETEPELGLGVIENCGGGRVAVVFPAAEERRQYALASAPLKRVRFREGDRIRTRSGRDVTVNTIEEDDHGLLTYIGEQERVTEGDLADAISLNQPLDRLLAGRVDEPFQFELRVDALKWRGDLRRSPARGFVGARVDLIPHQLFIANEVSRRLRPRVLLADEVGLGKTIEAGLILHRLHLNGRADRVLILVPEPLIHQWFVELLRRFNLQFSLFDEERCQAIEANDPEANPFLDSQHVLCSAAFLAEDLRRSEQALSAGWDLLIVDEAHHLEWHPETPSAAYQLAARLASTTPGLLLLTATPQQLGPEGHFARLRLLDPERYPDLEAFLEQTLHYEEVARAVDRLLAGKKLVATDQRLFSAKSPRIQTLADQLGGKEDAETRSALVGALLDEFGTGRVMFRNTRSALKGFPERSAQITPVQGNDEGETTAKVKWLAGLLRKIGDAKVLVISKTRQLATDIVEQLLREIQVHASLFHEDLTLMQRDRNAAAFAEPDGARVLVCSEIGSEGRNFQFVHHLVLFDLPEDPELLEQRIGRLDRIGQTSTIHIHVPVVEGSAEQVLARWYHEGLDAFEHSLHGATELADGLRAELRQAMASPAENSLVVGLLKATQHRRKAVQQRLAKGHDRLLELSSNDPQKTTPLIAAMRELDSAAGFEAFFIRLLDHLGMHVEELGVHGYVLRPDSLITDALPAIPEEGMMVTFDRREALARDHFGFLTGDHPLVRGALDFILGGGLGNSSFAVWRRSGAEGLLLEAWFVLECVAPAALHVDRFLPPTPFRVVVDHAAQDQSEDASLTRARLMRGDPTKLLEKPALRKRLLPAMKSAAEKLAETQASATRMRALAAMNRQLTDEIERLEDLRQFNDHVTEEDVMALREQQSHLAEAIRSARLRLDAIRLILRAT